MVRFVSTLSVALLCGVFTVGSANAISDTAAQVKPTDSRSGDRRADQTRFDSSDPADHDPFEPLNRAIFQFNLLVDGLLIKPVAMTYNAVLPLPARTGVGNVLTHLREPLGFASATLQLEGKRAGAHLLRFVFNSIFGLFGLVDVAGKMGLQARPEGTEAYLARTGLGSGPYIMLPILGPSDGRNTLGTIADFFVDPVNIAARTYKRGTYADFSGGTARYHKAKYRYAPTVRSGLQGLHSRSQNVASLDALERNSFDFYAAVRSAYQQQTQSRNEAASPSKER